MNEMNKMSSMHEGDSARIEMLLLKGDMRRRLQDLGLIEGTRVHCTQKSPCGDPIAYAVRGAIIALRTEDAQEVLVGRMVTM